MSIFDIFSPAPKPAPAPAPADTSAAPISDLVPPVPTPPAPTGTDPAPPLADFAKLWEPDATKPAAQDSVFGNLDPAKIFEAAKSANFAGAINPEVLQSVAAGGEGAVQALQSAINSATQAAFAQSTLAATKLIEQAISKSQESQLKNLPDLVRKHTAADSLLAENPALSNPAAAPIIQAIQAQLSTKFPQASTSELTTMAKKYLENFASVVAPPKPAEPVAAKPGEMDWSKYLE
jgi:hypothetical protein